MFRSKPRIRFKEKDDEENYSKNYRLYAIMEDLLEKLKMLNYETEFLTDLNMKPIDRYYFVNAKNKGEQFHLFSLLAAWLIRKAGKEIEQPQETSDPNDTISNILKHVPANEVKIEFIPSKLKQGFGDQVILLLNHLSKVAVKKSILFIKTFVTCKDPEPEIFQQVDDGSEIKLKKVEEEMRAAYTPDTDEEENLDDLSGFISDDQHMTAEELEDWRLEVARVAPRLKVIVILKRGWKSYLQAIKPVKIKYDKAVPLTSREIMKFYRDLDLDLNKLERREKYINKELDKYLMAYRIKLDQLVTVRENYEKMKAVVPGRDKEFEKLSDKLISMKKQMQERESSMTDGTSLVNIKKAITNIRQEIKIMDLRIGVLDCILLQRRIRNEEKINENLKS